MHIRILDHWTMFIFLQFVPNQIACENTFFFCIFVLFPSIHQQDNSSCLWTGASYNMTWWLVHIDITKSKSTAYIDVTLCETTLLIQMQDSLYTAMRDRRTAQQVIITLLEDDRKYFHDFSRHVLSLTSMFLSQTVVYKRVLFDKVSPFNCVRSSLYWLWSSQ